MLLLSDNGEKSFDVLLKQLNLNPIYNLEILADYLTEKTDSESCCILSDGNTVISRSNSGSVPICAETTKKSASLRIPIILKKPEYHRIVEKRIKNKGTIKNNDYILLQLRNGKTALPPKTLPEYDALINLIGQNLDSYRTHITASTDKLTRTLNKKYLDIATEQAFEKAKRTGGNLSFIICDLDFFKHVNDTYGHLIGDEVLCATANVISDTLGPNSIFGRFGGEEFVVLLENTDSSAAFVIAEQIRAAVYNARLLDSKRDVTISLGIASYPEHAKTVKSLTEKADKALYAAKKNGRNRCEVYCDSYNDTFATKNTIPEFITGDTLKDAAGMLVMFDILNLSKLKLSKKQKIDTALAKILDTAGGSRASLFLLRGTEIIDIVSVSETSGLHENLSVSHNYKVIDEVIRTRNPVFKVDWDNDASDVSGTPDWQSLAVVPVIKNDTLKGVLYLNVSVKTKEFNNGESGFLYNAGILLSVII